MSFKNISEEMVLKIITDYDPIGLIEMGAPSNEYTSEALEIYKRLQADYLNDLACKDTECMLSIDQHMISVIGLMIYSVFVFSFDPITAGMPSLYNKIASDLVDIKNNLEKNKPQLRLVVSN